MNDKLINDSFTLFKKCFENVKPEISMILGSGWGAAAEAFKSISTLEYSRIPAMGEHRGPAGHSGRVTLAEHAGKQLLIFQGRRHWYEGLGWEPVCFPVILSAKLNVKTIMLTNAAGSLDDNLHPGSLMIIDDHINFMGVNPLAGKYNPDYGPMFADQSNIYDKDLSSQLEHNANKLGTQLYHGVYIATSGPNYETPSETQMLRNTNARAVGMSTVPEAIIANSMGLRVLGISCITNFAAGISTRPLSHIEVIEQTDKALPFVRKILPPFLEEVLKNDRT